MVTVKIDPIAPVVTYSVMGITILVFLLQMGSLALLQGLDLPQVLGMKVNSLILQGQVWRLVTPMLLHDDAGITHILLNMYGLYAFGPNLERHYGHSRFLVLYLLAGYTGNVMSFLFSVNNSLGASTAIFGLLGAEGMFLYQNRKLFGANARSALTNIIILAVINLGLGFSTRSGLDNWGHLGGLLGGTLFAWSGGPVLKLEGVFPSFHLADTREKRDVVIAGLSVFLLFSALVLAAFFMRR